MSEHFALVDLNEQNIQTVLQQSMQKPVLLALWSPVSQEHAKVVNLFVRLVQPYRDRIILARLNINDHPMIAQQLGMTRVPVVKIIVQGQLLAELTGAEPEDQIKALLERLAGPPGEVIEEEQNEADILGRIEKARSLGKLEEALAVLRTAIQKNEKNLQLQALLAQVHLDQGDEAEAQSVLNTLPEQDPWREQVQARIRFMQAAKALDKSDTTEYGAGVRAVLAGDFEQAGEKFFAVFSQDQDTGRQALLDLIAFMGPQEPLAKQYRRKLFALLH